MNTHNVRIQKFLHNKHSPAARNDEELTILDYSVCINICTCPELNIQYLI